MSKIEVDAIDKQSGSTLTLGGSGTAVTLGAGATQSGFGRTGTVDWQTGSIKTATFTAVSGEGYFCNTTSGGFVVNLPAGSAGAIVSVQDYNNTFDSNSITITPNGSEKINGGTGSILLDTEGEGITLVYVDGTVGWRSIQDSSFADVGSNFIIATGGTITTSGDCKIHTFTGPGTFTVTGAASCAANNVVSHLVLAGGAGGGGGQAGGGGGAGGYREVKSPVTPYTASPLDGYPSAPNRVTVTATAFPITVGAGGASKSPPAGPNLTGNPGSNSVFSTVTSAGGGGGGMYGGGGAGTPAPAPKLAASAALNGGSGGGGGSLCSGSAPARELLNNQGTGNTPPVSPSQGNNGGKGLNMYYYAAAGGGGAGATGTNASGPGVTAPQSVGGAGGAGVATSITATPVTRAGGGGGVGFSSNAAGGSGGGGAGAHACTSNGAGNGTANTGGGGGGAGPTGNASGTGGSGIVVIRYKFK